MYISDQSTFVYLPAACDSSKRTTQLKRDMWFRIVTKQADKEKLTLSTSIVQGGDAFVARTQS
jgi:hypothetical protein